MPTIDLGNVKGDTGASMRIKGAWTASTSYVNNAQYIDIVTYGGSSYSCKTSHTSGSSFASDKWNLVAKKGDKGDIGITPTIQAGTATALDATAAPTVSATTSGNTTTFNFGIPKGDISEIKTPTFNDSVSTYTTLNAANTAAETASNAIKSKVNIFTTLSNIKKSFSAIVQGLKILGTNVGAINGITDSLTSTSSNIAASAAAIKTLNDKTTELNSNIDTLFPVGANGIPIGKSCAITAPGETLEDGLLNILNAIKSPTFWIGYVKAYPEATTRALAIIAKSTPTRGCAIVMWTHKPQMRYYQFGDEGLLQYDIGLNKTSTTS